MTEQEMLQGVMQDPMQSTSTGMQESARGVVDSLKSQFSVDKLVNNVKTYREHILEAGLYAGIGFISGFLLKKYSTYVGVCILLLIALGVLSHLNVITVIINWDKVSDLFGIRAAYDVTADNIITLVWEWVKVNLVISISYIIGLFIGLKVG